MNPDEALEFGVARGREIGQAILEDPEIIEAVQNAVGWLEIAYDRLMAQGELPGLYVATNLLCPLELCLMRRLMEPREVPES